MEHRLEAISAGIHHGEVSYLTFIFTGGIHSPPPNTYPTHKTTECYSFAEKHIIRQIVFGITKFDDGHHYFAHLMVLGERQILCTVRQGYDMNNEANEPNAAHYQGDIKCEMSINLRKGERVVAAKVNCHRRVSTDV